MDSQTPKGRLAFTKRAAEESFKEYLRSCNTTTRNNLEIALHHFRMEYAKFRRLYPDVRRTPSDGVLPDTSDAANDDTENGTGDNIESEQAGSDTNQVLSHSDRYYTHLTN